MRFGRKVTSPPTGENANEVEHDRTRDFMNYMYHVIPSFRLYGSLSPPHEASSGCGWKRQPPDMEDSCEYIE
jgi:hypothetical protein